MQPCARVFDREKRAYREGRWRWDIVQPSSDEYTFCVRKYLEDFRIAVDNYINGLNNDTESVSDLEAALNRKPQLI